MKKNRSEKKPVMMLFSLLLFLTVMATGIYTLTFAGRQGDAEWQQNTEDAIKRAVVSCYAIEGIYPPNLEYLQEHYGLIVDQNRYVVHYEVFASNIMPEIDVYPLPK